MKADRLKRRAQFAVILVVACGVMTTFVFLTYRLESEKHTLAVASQVHVGLFDGAVWFSSHRQPYRGSVIQIGDQPALTQRRAVDFPGVYYRWFRFSEGETWTLRVSLWYAIVCLAFTFILISLRHTGLVKSAILAGLTHKR